MGFPKWGSPSHHGFQDQNGLILNDLGYHHFRKPPIEQLNKQTNRCYLFVVLPASDNTFSLNGIRRSGASTSGKTHITGLMRFKNLKLPPEKEHIPLPPGWWAKKGTLGSELECWKTQTHHLERLRDLHKSTGICSYMPDARIWVEKLTLK